jgi:sialate O-acetylesterase
MVLQRGGARLWGLDGKPSESVTISIDGQKAGSCTASVDGKWTVDVSSDAGWNHTIKVAGSSGRSTVLTDVAFGDVILCSGQSNSKCHLGL